MSYPIVEIEPNSETLVSICDQGDTLQIHIISGSNGECLVEDQHPAFPRAVEVRHFPKFGGSMVWVGASEPDGEDGIYIRIFAGDVKVERGFDAGVSYGMTERISQSLWQNLACRDSQMVTA